MLRNMLVGIIVVAGFLVIGQSTILAGDVPWIYPMARLCAGDSVDYFGGYIEPAGDQNNDGYDDFWVGATYRGSVDSNGIPLYRSRLYLGGTTIDTMPLIILRGFYTVKNVGDVDHDGFDDFMALTTQIDIPYPVFYGGPDIDTIPDLVFDPSYLGLNSSKASIFSLAGGCDINDDSVADIAIGESGASRVTIYFGEEYPDTIADLVIIQDSTERFSNFGFNVVFISDFIVKGDRYLATNRSSNLTYQESGSVLLYEAGDALDDVPDIEIRTPEPWTAWYYGTLLRNVGDVNGDGFTDIVCGVLGGWNSFLYFGGPDFDTIPDVTIAPPNRGLESIGDVNNDGYPDIIAKEEDFKGWAFVYYGGPNVDGFVDAKPYVPSECITFGRGISGSLGDVNGDGIDDFAVGGQIDTNPEKRFPGVLYIYPGYDSIPTDVAQIKTDLLPEQLRLHPNYPNPFNPITTIEFDLPRRANVSLKVYNILGELVTTLVNEQLGAGHFRSTWDGRDSQGNAVSSGVYLYRLNAGEFSTSRKMMLLK